jgi:hypothetical protein
VATSNTAATLRERHVVGVDAARDADERPAEDERDHLVHRGPHTQAGRLVLVVGDREQAEAELAAPDEGRNRDGQDEQAEQRVIERPVLLGQAPRRQRQGETLAAARQPGGVRRHHGEQLQRGEGDEYMPRVRLVTRLSTAAASAQTRPPARQPTNGERLVEVPRRGGGRVGPGGQRDAGLGDERERERRDEGQPWIDALNALDDQLVQHDAEDRQRDGHDEPAQHGVDAEARPQAVAQVRRQDQERSLRQC